MAPHGGLSDFIGESTGIVFLGAGASRDSGLPLGDAAATGIIRECFRAAGLMRIFGELERTRSSGQLSLWPRFEVVLDFLEEYLPGAAADILETFKGVGISATHRLLADNLKGHWLWLTTNFDDQIERALRSVGAPCTVLRSRRQIEQVRHLLTKGHVIVKLHGDANSHPDEVGVTIHQILRTFPARLNRCLTRIAMGRPVLFVGYAARDPDLRMVIEGLITKSAKLAWIGKGRITPRIKALLSPRLSERPYYGQGAARSLCREWRVKLPTPVKSVAWADRLTMWTRRKAGDPNDRKRLCHFLAAVCVSRDTGPCRTATQKILACVPARNEPYRRWTFGHQLRLLEQVPAAANAALTKSLKRWEDSLDRDRYRQTPEVRSECYCSISHYYRKHGDYVQARRLAERAVRILPSRRANRQRVNALRTLGLAQVYCGARWLKIGCETLSEAAGLARRINEPVFAAQATEEFAFACLRANKPQKAASLLSSARSAFAEIGDPRLMVSFERNFAESIRATGLIDKALTLNRRALNYAILLDDYEGRRKATNNLALCEVQLGHIVEADRALAECVSEARLKGRVEYQTDPLANRAWLRFLIGDWPEAYRFFQAAVALELKRGSDERAGGALCELGWCQLCLGQTDDARETLYRVKGDGLIPAGPPRGYYLILKLALAKNRPATKTFIERAERQLGVFPEQRFFALLWFLQSGTPTPVEVRSLVGRCWVAVKKAGQPVLASLLSHVLHAHPEVNAVLRQAIKKFGAGPLKRLQKGLRAQARTT